ncbi:MAG: nucleoside deaminase, partial [Hymenobacteraceae bacterium]|nr:nucleoside deaminase [Hymenobacteraceae bacterium]MDX5480170.1 nucleoside deaminase [Hymenobacteraceae bacterium]
MNETFMREAITLSIEKMQQGLGGPFGAVVVRNGAVVARGYNNVLSSNDPTAHAEVDAIRKACQALGTYQLTDCDLYTSCEPCPMCLGAIYWARFRKVYYGNTREDAAQVGFDDAFIYEEIGRAPEHRHIPMEQLLPAEARAAFELWEQKEDKQDY